MAVQKRIKLKINRRLITWIPEGKEWIKDALKERVKNQEEKGLPSSVSNEALKILVAALAEDYVSVESESPSAPERDD